MNGTEISYSYFRGKRKARPRTQFQPPLASPQTRTQSGMPRDTILRCLNCSDLHFLLKLSLRLRYTRQDKFVHANKLDLDPLPGTILWTSSPARDAATGTTPTWPTSVRSFTSATRSSTPTARRRCLSGALFAPSRPSLTRYLIMVYGLRMTTRRTVQPPPLNF